MTAERDEEMQDELLRDVVAELRRPVGLDPAIDARVLDTIRAGKAPGRRPRWIAPVGGAALAAGVALALFLGRGASSGSATRQVQLRLAAPASSRVVVVGDFNDWDPLATPLRATANSGVWTVELRLKPGRYHYSFLLDGRRWVRDPAEPPAAESDFGTPMSVLTVS
jgi:hypothetical protein